LSDLKATGTSGDSLVTDIENNSPYTQIVFASGSANAVSGNLFDFGEVTQFVYTAVPEPSTWVLAACAAVGSLLVARRQYRGRKRAAE